jgi:hypothetical protein
MAEPDRESTLEAAQKLGESMESLRGEISALRQYGRRNRTLIWGLCASLLLDILLSVAVYFVAIQASEATSQAAINRQNAVSTCEAGNQARAVSTQLWTYVLDLSEQNNPTPERKQRIDQFRAHIGEAYSPRDCAQPK